MFKFRRYFFCESSNDKDNEGENMSEKEGTQEFPERIRSTAVNSLQNNTDRKDKNVVAKLHEKRSGLS